MCRKSWAPRRTFGTGNPREGAPSFVVEEESDDRGRKPDEEISRRGRARGRRNLVRRREGRGIRPPRPERGRQDDDPVDAVVPPHAERRERARRGTRRREGSARGEAARPAGPAGPPRP